MKTAKLIEKLKQWKLYYFLCADCALEKEAWRLGSLLAEAAKQLEEFQTKLKDMEPVVHAHWIAETFGTYIPVEFDENDNLVVHEHVRYKCSVCGRIERKKEPYCNCGAKMNEKEIATTQN